MHKYIIVIFFSIISFFTPYMCCQEFKKITITPSQHHFINNEFYKKNDYKDRSCAYFAFMAALKIQSQSQKEIPNIEKINIDLKKDTFFGVPYGNYIDPATFTSIIKTITIHEENEHFYGKIYSGSELGAIKHIVYFKYNANSFHNLGGKKRRQKMNIERSIFYIKKYLKSLKNILNLKISILI